MHPFKITFVCITLQLFTSLTFGFGKGKKCPGKCTRNIPLCKEKGGRILGYCTPESVCCDLTSKYVGSCGSRTIGLRTATFQSPGYPLFSSGNLDCSFFFEINQNNNFDGILVEFLDVVTEGVGFGESRLSSCQIDMILIRGFKHWMPPARCGNLTGYSIVIDKASAAYPPHINPILSIVSIMSSDKWKWNIRISLLSTPFKKQPTSHGHATILKPVIEENPSISSEEDEDSTIVQEPFVVNGMDTNISSTPWQASLRVLFPPYVFQEANVTSSDFNRHAPNCSVEGSHFCGGSIISKQFILTASHCFHPLSKGKRRGWKHIDDVQVFLGETDLCEDDLLKYGRKGQSFSIEKIIMHYAYDPLHLGLNDIMLLKLKDKIQFNDNIKPIALSKRGRSYIGKVSLVSGWGKTNLTIPDSNGGLSIILQSANGIIIQDSQLCDNYLQEYYSEYKGNMEGYPKFKNTFSSLLCTMSNTSSSSKLSGPGDSGGGLVATTGEGEDVQIGVVSFALSSLQREGSQEHDNPFVDYYQDVGYFRDWIDLAMSI